MENDQVLCIKNWAKFQHYKHRKPPWIRLYRDLLDSLEFHSLPLASRALAPMLWLLASDTVEGCIEYDPEQIAFRLRMSTDELSGALEPLLIKGFVSLASNTLAPCKQHAIPEGETERETETKKPRAQTRSARNRFDEMMEQKRKIEAQAKRLLQEQAVAVELNVGGGPR
jgi:hypothetical protein